jgi:plasmid stabilization system protein ParE
VNRPSKKLIGKIKEAVMSLSVMPTRHSLVADEKLAIQGIRKIMVDNYIVFYVVSEKDSMVTVIRILYGRRDWMNII